MITPSQFADFTIPYKQVLARLGYAHGRTAIDDNTGELLKQEMESAKKIISPKQVVSSSKIESANDDTVMLKPGFTIKSKDIFKLLSNCSEAFGLSVTIGPHLEEKRNLYIQQKETARALILDAIGSETADYLADITSRQIQAEAEKNGFKTTLRYSPGYGDWQLAGQKDFLKWLGAAKIGITLNESFQMKPEKSVTAILGIYKP